ncbi:MAG: hypothetical protein ACRYGP_02635 [Janthinobacterium lividum]
MSIQRNHVTGSNGDQRLRPVNPGSEAITLDAFELKRQRSRANDKAKTAYKLRLAAEQAEARALGVEIIPKLSTSNRYNEAEHNVIRQLYPDFKAMQKHLPSRSYNSIRRMCAVLGIQNRKLSDAKWTGPEITKLKRIYPVIGSKELLEAFPHKTRKQITTQAGYLRLKRPKREMRATGHPLLDEVRRRAIELNYTMTDLDKIAHTKHYFEGNHWRRGLTMPPLIAAIHALGGTVTADWGDSG